MQMYGIDEDNKEIKETEWKSVPEEYWKDIKSVKKEYLLVFTMIKTFCFLLIFLLIFIQLVRSETGFSMDEYLGRLAGFVIPERKQDILFCLMFLYVIIATIRAYAELLSLKIDKFVCTEGKCIEVEEIKNYDHNHRYMSSSYSVKVISNSGREFSYVGTGDVWQIPSLKPYVGQAVYIIKAAVSDDEHPSIDCIAPIDISEYRAEREKMRMEKEEKKQKKTQKKELKKQRRKIRKEKFVQNVIERRISIIVLMCILVSEISGAVYLYKENIAYEQAVALQEEKYADIKFANLFSLAVFGKRYEDAKVELTQIKYLEIENTFAGQVNRVKYSFSDYLDFVNEEEFEATIEVWECADKCYNFPLNLTMFTGLTRINTKVFVSILNTNLSEECKISYIEAINSRPEDIRRM